MGARARARAREITRDRRWQHIVSGSIRDSARDLVRASRTHCDLAEIMLSRARPHRGRNASEGRAARLMAALMMLHGE